MSNAPVPMVMKRALPPVLVPVKVVDAPLPVVMVALPAVLESLNVSVALFVIVAVPAVAELLNERSALLMTFAAPAVLLSLKLQMPKQIVGQGCGDGTAGGRAAERDSAVILPMVADRAVATPSECQRAVHGIGDVGAAAERCRRNPVLPLLTTVAVPAVLFSLKCRS